MPSPKNLLVLLALLFIQHFNATAGIPVANQREDEETADTGATAIFRKYTLFLNGDSFRYSPKGYLCQNWFCDYYANGKLLLKGFYVDGKLKIFKNYFENGQIECEFKTTGTEGYSVKTFFKDGTTKSEIENTGNVTIKEQYFYASGQIQYIEERTKKGYLIQMKSYNERGIPQSIVELTDSKHKIFYQKEFDENGNIIEEGPIKYSTDYGDYVKDGKWTFYLDSGAVSEIYVYGSGGNEN